MQVKLHLKLSDLFREVFNTLFILLAYCVYFLYSVAYLHSAGSHLVHAVGDDARQFIEFLHFLGYIFAAAKHLGRAVVDLVGYHIYVSDS